MRNHRFLLVVGMLVFLSGGITWAQETTGTISGTVKDTSGAVIPGAKIEVLNVGTGISRTVKTDASGRYEVPSLSLGDYQVTGSHEGFQTEVRSGIGLTVGREAVVDMTLAVGSETQQVVVTGEAPLVESTTATLGALVDDRSIRELPLNGRSYDQLALLQPGVTLESYGASTPTNAAFIYGTGDRFSVGGQPETSNGFLLDGTNIDDWANGTPGGAAGTNLGVDTILEFKVFTNSFKAEYGRVSGSIVSAVTRSGSNALHGTAFEYIRNSVLDDRNYFDVGSSPPPFRRNQFGGVLGGPIKKDRTFFFGGYEGLRQGLATTLIATVPTALAKQGILPTQTVPVNPASVPYLNLYPLPNGRDYGDGTAQYLSAPLAATNEDNVMARVDHQLNDKTSIFGRYTFDRDNVNGEQSIPNLFLFESSQRQYATVQANTILGPKTLNNFRFAYNRSSAYYNNLMVPDPGPALDIIPGQPFGLLQVGAIASSSVRAITSLGTALANGPNVWAFNVFEEGDDFSYIKGKHTFKIGADVQRFQDNETSPEADRGELTFTDFNNFLTGQPSSLTTRGPVGALSTLRYDFRQTLYAAYAQDDYTVNSRLTLNLGLRWEATTDPTSANGGTAQLPSPAATATVLTNDFFSITKKNFEPRFGLALRLDDSGKTVLRAGGGIYHNQILPWAYWGEINVPPFASQYILANPPFPDSYLPLVGIANTNIGNGSQSLKVITPTTKTPVNDEYNLSIQQAIFRNTVIQIAYAGDHSNHLLTKVEANTPIPVICPASPCPAGVPNGYPYYITTVRRNTAWGSIGQYQTNGNANYNGLTILLRTQSSSGLVGEIFYTWSRALDMLSNVSGGEGLRSPSAFLDPEDPRRDWGPDDFNVTNALGFNFAFPIPFRVGSKTLGAVVNSWTLDGIGTFQSGMPFTPVLSASVSHDGAKQFAERPNLVLGASQNPIKGTSAGCPGFAAGTRVGTPKNWYDPCAFSLPISGTYGDLGRNTIIGPGITDIDAALEKSFKLREIATATFRFEMFNTENHANFGLPNDLPLATTGAANPSAGVVTYTTTPARTLQFALRISF